jgi:hypothetical protein
MTEARLSGWRTAARRAALLMAAGAGFGAAAYARDAGAQPATAVDGASMRVLVRAQVCDPQRYEPTELLRLLELELAALGMQAEPLPESDAAAEAALTGAAALIAIECGPAPAGVAVRVSDLVSGKQLSRELSVADVGRDARARAVALSAVTALESSLSELLSSAPAARALPPNVERRLRARMLQNLGPEATAAGGGTQPDAARAAVAPRSDAARELAGAPASPALRVDVDAVLRAFPGRATGLLGAGVAIAPALGRALRLTFGAEALYGKSDLADAQGKIGVMNLYWITGSAGLAWLAAGSAGFELGPRVIAGYALAAADVERTGARGSDQSGFVLATVLAARARWPLAGGAHAAFGADLGYAPIGVVFLGDQARLAGMADTTFALRIGVDF